MALLWADSFDHYGSGSVGADNMRLGAWSHVGSSVSLATNYARTGTYSVFIGSTSVASGARLQKPLAGRGKAVVGVGMGVYLPSLPSGSRTNGFYLSYNTKIILSFVYQPDGSIVIYKGPAYDSSTPTIGATDAGVISAGTFQHVEVAAFIDTIAGWIEIRVDGVRVYRIEEIDTGSDPVTLVSLGNTHISAGASAMYLDDVFAWDDDNGVNISFIGPASIETVFASGDTLVGDWGVVGSPTKFGAINDVPPNGDTSYIYAEEPGEAIEFTLPELPAEVTALAGIYVPPLARLADVGVGRVRASLVYEGQREDGTEVPLTSAYAYRQGGVFQVNPVTGDIWTKEQFKDATLRLEKTL